ncbi:MAG: putative lipid II flippase FtsW [Acidobacteriota bacterium]
MTQGEFDRVLLWIILSLLAFGVVMGYSASAVISQEKYGASTSLVARQVLYIVAGLIAMAVCMRVNYRIYASRAFVAGALTVCLAGLALVFLFPETNGARRWIKLGSSSIQPSEFAKIALVVFAARYLTERQDVLNKFWKGLAPVCGVVGVFVALILLEPDLGTSACIALTVGVMLYVAGLSVRYLIGAALLVLPAFYALILRVPWRRDRVLAFLDPFNDPYGIGYQVRQSLLALGSGGWSGAGLAQGRGKLFFLPEPHTDFIYAVIGEELGMLGCAVVVTLFLLLYWRGIKGALRAPDNFGRYLGIGLVAMVSLQAFINLSVVLSLMPTKGIPLPLVSMGGSSVTATLMGLGILLNVSRREQRAGDAGNRELRITSCELPSMRT